MPNYEILEMDLPIKRVQLEIQKFCAMAEFDASAIIKSVEMRRFQEYTAQKMVYQLMARVASKKYAVKTVRFPDGPWQFVKFNLIGSKLYAIKSVRWFLKRFPIRYNDVTLEASAYYPEIEIPDKAAFVEIVMRARNSYYE